MTEPLVVRSDYMRHLHGPWEKVLTQANEYLGRRKYDTLVGTGLSGALLVPRLAAELGKHWLVVRKPGDDTHAWCKAEGSIGARWIFVDDLVDSGATFDRVMETVKKITSRHTTQYVGTYLYNEPCWHGARWRP